jgi:electron transfer flavoprotein alpha subunit
MPICKVLVYAEIAGGKILPSYYELLSKAKAVWQGERVAFAAAFASEKDEACLWTLETSGVDKVYAVQSERLAVYHPDYHAKALETIIREVDPDVVLIAATSAGEELAPTMGARFKTGVAAHAMDLVLKQDGTLAQMIPAFGGKVIGEIFTPGTRPKIVSIKPGIFKADAKCMAQETGSAKAVRIELDAACVEGMDSRIETLGAERRTATHLPVESAEVVVCGGYGVGSKESFGNLEKLAGMLSGAVGCTRPAVDAGFMADEANMVGTSGKSIRPKLYIGVGISGAAHHVCGMKDAGTIISINSDPDAPVFEASDYRIVADGDTVIRAIISQLEK